MNLSNRNIWFYLVLLLLIIGFVSVLASPVATIEQIPYTQFQKELDEGKYSSIQARPTGLTYSLEAVYRDGSDKKVNIIAPYSESSLIDLTADAGVSVTFVEQEEPSVLATFLMTMVPFLLIFLLFFFLINRSQGGGNKVMSFGKSKAKLYSEEGAKVTFKNVAGVDEEKEELEEIVDFLQDPRKYVALGATIPKGVLLVGPPGTGKTLLARAVAGEAGVPFYSISGSDFVEMFVGVGASRVRDLFETAKKNAPCIIFIDEIDAVGRQRGAGLGGGHDEREQTLNQLLVEMDGFGDNEGVIIIAATNRADILDPALLRPGRFDRHIYVDRPDVAGREAILKVHAHNKPLADDVNFNVIARRTPGFTGADLENLLNEAALLAARLNLTEITMVEIDNAIDRVIAGPEKKSRIISDKEKNIVAYHESGHAIVGYHLEGADEVHKVTVIPRGHAGGYTVILPKEDRSFMTKPELIDKIMGLLAGRVAEEEVLNEISTGAHNDFQRATEIARRMVTEFGMSEKLGPMQFGKQQSEVFLGRDYSSEPSYSDKTAYAIDMEVKGIIDRCYTRTKEIINKYRDELDLIAQSLMIKETLDAADIKKLMDDGKFGDEELDNQVMERIKEFRATT